MFTFKGQITMNSDPLDELLGAYARHSMPENSDRLHADVRRAIAERRRRPFFVRFLPVLTWRELFTEPRLAAACFVLAVGAGVLPALAVHRTVHSRLARSSLHLEVFTAAAYPIVASTAVR